MTQTKDAPTGLALLRQPFPDHQISKLPKETGTQAKQRKAAIEAGNWPKKCDVCGGSHHERAVHLDYVGHAALTARLLDADVAWSWEPVSLDTDGLPAFDRNGGLWIKLTVDGVTRLGYGDADGKSGGNAVKEAIGDALRNAAMRFGAALDLWHKGDLHADDEPAEAPKEMPDAEWAKLVRLIETTSADRGMMLKFYKVDNLRQLNQNDYADLIGKLTVKLEKLARAETDKKASFSDVLADEIPY